MVQQGEQYQLSSTPFKFVCMKILTLGISCFSSMLALAQPQHWKVETFQNVGKYTVFQEQEGKEKLIQEAFFYQTDFYKRFKRMKMANQNYRRFIPMKIPC